MAEVHLVVDYDHAATQRELEEVERLRPNDPEVHALRVRLEYIRGNWGEDLPRLIARAAELDPQNADLHASLGGYLSRTGRFASAEHMASRSWALSPTATTPHRLRSTNHLAWTGDIQGAWDIIESLPAQLASGTTLVVRARASLHALRGEIAAAIADYERVGVMVATTRLTTSGPQSANVIALYQRARLELRLGKTAPAAKLYVEALAAARKFLDDFPGLAIGSGTLALIHAGRGDKREALAAIDEAMRITAQTRNAAEIASMRQTKAEVLTVLGQHDAAIAELRTVHGMGYGFGYLLRRHLEWEPLHSHPKFQQLMKEAEARADAQPRPLRPR